MSGRRWKAAAALASLALATALGARAWTHGEGHSHPTAVPPTERPENVVVPSEPPAPVPQRLPVLRGRVFDAEGNLVPDATVRVVTARPPWQLVRAAQTDGRGSFAFDALTPGPARVVAEHGEAGVVTSAVVPVTDALPTNLTLVLSPSIVHGTVVDPHDTPVAGASVTVTDLPWKLATTTDESGAFRLTAVPELARGLAVVARGFETGHAAFRTASDGGDVVLRVVLAAADPVAGEVRDPDDHPVAAHVTACAGTPSEATVDSAADGSFQLPPSTIGCQAVATSHELSPSDPAPVVSGAPLVLRLKAGASIAGIVVDERGDPLSPFRLGIESFAPAFGKPGPLPAPRSFDDGTGTFRWEKLPPGTYVLTASVSGRPPARSAPVDVRAASETDGVRIVASRGGAIEGTVTDDAHAPLAGVELRFDQVSRVAESDAAATTDASGHYRLEGAPDGLLTIRCRKDGYRMKLVSGVRVAAGATRRQDVVLSLLDGGPGMELGGIGAGLADDPDGLVIRNVGESDPAGVAGLRPGDRIVAIDGEPTDGMSITDALQRIRGEAGTTVGLTVRRAGSGELVDRVVVRGTIVR